MNDIEKVRSFNRTVTQRIGALQNHFLGRDRSLGASRLLFEIGTSGIEIRQLRSRLGLDSGYVSRLLRVLEGQKLIRIVPSKNDARVGCARLTRRGIHEVELLNRLSDKAALGILNPLTERQRCALLSAMNTVETLLCAGSISISIDDPRSPQSQKCLSKYYQELARRFDHGFNPESSISADPDEISPPHGYFLLAKLNDEEVGCGALKCHSGWGEIKRMWVAESVRGLGIGKKILQRLEELARTRKLRTLRLETNKSLTEARALYASSGYREVKAFNEETYAHHWFEKKLHSKSGISK